MSDDKNMKHLEDEALENVSGGCSEQKITADCYYCGAKHVLTF